MSGQGPGGGAGRLSPRAIILEILRNMRESAEEMYSHSVVPSFFQVYLHGRDFARLQPVFARLTADAKVALDNELANLNRVRLFDRFVAAKPARWEAGDREWKVEIFQDPDDEQPAGTVRIQSQLMLPALPGIRQGALTRFTITRTGDAPEPKNTPAAASSAGHTEDRPVLAEIRIVSGAAERTVLMKGDELLLGRGGPDIRVDVEIANPSVSEGHARIHYVRLAGMFYLENRGKYGTSVEGRQVAAGSEVSLGRRSRIGMANDTVLLEFIAMG